MKIYKFFITVFILAISLFQSCYAMYEIISEKEQQEKYNEVVSKLTPEMLGFMPTNDYGYYTKEEIQNYKPEQTEPEEYHQNIENHDTEQTKTEEYYQDVQTLNTEDKKEAVMIKFFDIILAAMIWIIPALILSLIIKKIVKKKISKGWCVFISGVSIFTSAMTGALLVIAAGGEVNSFGGIDYLSAGIAISIIFGILYDKNIPSILDTEKELKSKLSKNKENKIENN